MSWHGSPILALYGFAQTRNDVPAERVWDEPRSIERSKTADVVLELTSNLYISTRVQKRVYFPCSVPEQPPAFGSFAAEAVHGNSSSPTTSTNRTQDAGTTPVSTLTLPLTVKAHSHGAHYPTQSLRTDVDPITSLVQIE